MSIFLTILHVTVCFVLILVILLQAGRGQGLTGPSFASGNVQSLFGTRAADFLTKATSVSAICFLLTCFGLDYLEARKSRSLLEGSRQAPMDISRIKKALEKIKKEEAQKKAAASSPQKKVAAAPAVPVAAKKTEASQPTGASPAQKPSPAPGQKT